MKAASVTIFVREQNGIFVARSYGQDAIDRASKPAAARKCAARHLDVAESSVKLVADGPDEHVFMAYVQEPRKPTDWGNVFAFIAVAALTASAAFLAYAAGMSR